ncbi:hypothetical protein [Nocardia suismassiliense]|uniref:hypothetical protein n=1 Tax=Nocardia suismassiliense TaxID=2077092 RepID=UPI000D1F1F3A|nr:hypothetical protein [Nocardia suismassiliense]
MSGHTMVYLFACLLALATICLRLTRWRSQPKSRPLTIVVALLIVSTVLRHPVVLESDWLDDQLPENLHLANITDLLGDLVTAAAAGYICSLVAQAWGFEHLRPWIVRIFTADALVLLMLWAVSDAPHTHIKYVDQLGGPALLYSYVAATTVLISHLAVLASVLIARLSRKTRLALLPMVLGAFLATIGNLIRIGSHVAPSIFADLREHFGWPIILATTLLYTASGLIGYFAYPRRAKSAVGPQPGTVR